MAYTTPRTWVPGEVVTAALLNAHLRDNLLAIGAPSGPTTVGTTFNVSAHAGLVLFDLDYTVGGGGAAVGGVLVNLPAPYRPAATRYIIVYNNTTAADHLLTVTTAGDVSPTSVAMTAGHRFLGSAAYRL